MGSELSAASGRSSEVSEWPRSKFPASAVRQHRNFGHRNRVIVPYGGIQGVREKNPPVTALPCQPPLGKGALRTGDADCHSRCAHRLRNDRVFTRGAVCGGTHGSRPIAEHFVGQGPCALPGCGKNPVRADVGIGPYNRISAPRKKTAERRSFSCIYLL